MKRLADPFLSSVVALTALVLGGFVVIALSWRGVAANSDVSKQVPFVVSGAATGLALIGFGAGVLAIQLRRLAEARRRAEVDQLVAVAGDMLAAVRGERHSR